MFTKDPYNSQTNLVRRKLLLVAGAVLFLIIIIFAVLAAVSSKSNPASGKGFSQFEDENFSILYPSDAVITTEGSTIIFTVDGNDKTQSETIVVKKYLSDETSTIVIEQLKDLSTKNLLGETVAKSQELTVNGLSALQVSSKEGGFVTEKLFVIGSPDTWLIEINSSKKNGEVSVNALEILKSFKLTSGGAN